MMNGLWVILPGVHAGNLPLFLPMITGNFDGFSADRDGVTDRLPDGLTDKSDEVQTERNFVGFGVLGNFIQQYSWLFSLNLADG